MTSQYYPLNRIIKLLFIYHLLGPVYESRVNLDKDDEEDLYADPYLNTTHTPNIPATPELNNSVHSIPPQYSTLSGGPYVNDEYSSPYRRNLFPTRTSPPRTFSPNSNHSSPLAADQSSPMGLNQRFSPSQSRSAIFRALAECKSKISQLSQKVSELDDMLTAVSSTHSSPSQRSLKYGQRPFISQQYRSNSASTRRSRTFVGNNNNNPDDSLYQTPSNTNQRNAYTDSLLNRGRSKYQQLQQQQYKYVKDEDDSSNSDSSNEDEDDIHTMVKNQNQLKRDAKEYIQQKYQQQQPRVITTTNTQLNPSPSQYKSPQNYRQTSTSPHYNYSSIPKAVSATIEEGNGINESDTDSRPSIDEPLPENIIPAIRRSLSNKKKSKRPPSPISPNVYHEIAKEHVSRSPSPETRHMEEVLNISPDKNEGRKKETSSKKKHHHVSPVINAIKENNENIVPDMQLLPNKEEEEEDYRSNEIEDNNYEQKAKELIEASEETPIQQKIKEEITVEEQPTEEILVQENKTVEEKLVEEPLQEAVVEEVPVAEEVKSTEETDRKSVV